jgi:hypothetical protein
VGLHPLSQQRFDDLLKNLEQDHFVPEKYMKILAGAIK